MTEFWLDGASYPEIVAYATTREGGVTGFTTNPTLMKRASIGDLETFAKAILEAASGMPVSLEVFADEPAGMIRQGLKLASWGENVLVKVPITNTRGEFCAEAITTLLNEGVRVNVTAITTVDQVRLVHGVVGKNDPVVVSIFAGRIADCGVDPRSIVREAVEAFEHKTGTAILWASARQIYNVIEARNCGCHVITLSSDLLRKRTFLGESLSKMSLDTVRQFHADAETAGYSL